MIRIEKSCYMLIGECIYFLLAPQEKNSGYEFISLLRNANPSFQDKGVDFHCINKNDIIKFLTSSFRHSPFVLYKSL